MQRLPSRLRRVRLAPAGRRPHRGASSSSSRGAPAAAPQRERLFPEELNILYDSKCNICQLEMDFLARRDAARSGVASRRRIRLTDVEGAGYDPADPRNGGVSYARGMASIHAVASDGRVMEGVPVFHRAYDLVGLGWLFRFTEWPWTQPVVRWAYRLFARHRTRVTRGASLDALVQQHNRRNATTEESAGDECHRCSDARR